MIIEKKKLFFKTISVMLEDEILPEIIKSKEYSSIVVLSYNKLNLQGFFGYSKPTLLIDLTKSENDILSGFNDTTRNEIRKTDKIENLMFEMKDRPDEDSYELYKRFEYSQERVPVNIDILKKNIFFAAYLDQKLISGIYVTPVHPYLVIRSIFSARLATEDKDMYKIIAYSTRRLVWEACVWGKRNGYVSLDMASVNIHNPKTLSIAKFKMSFGKDLTPEYTYIYKTLLFSLFEKLVKVKLLFKKILFALKNK